MYIIVLVMSNITIIERIGDKTSTPFKVALF